MQGNEVGPSETWGATRAGTRPRLMRSGARGAASRRAAPRVLCWGGPAGPQHTWAARPAALCPSEGEVSALQVIRFAPRRSVKIAPGNKAFPLSFPDFSFPFRGSKHSLQITTVYSPLMHQNITACDSVIEVFGAISHRIQQRTYFIKGTKWI